jgi:hypothetical protein
MNTKIDMSTSCFHKQQISYFPWANRTINNFSTRFTSNMFPDAKGKKEWAIEHLSILKLPIVQLHCHTNREFSGNTNPFTLNKSFINMEIYNYGISC